jgi:hypothetical protein
MNIYEKSDFAFLPTLKTKSCRLRVPYIFLVLPLALCLLASAATAYGFEEKEPEETTEEIEIQQLVVPIVTGQVAIDAVLDEPFWQQAAIIEIKRELYPTPLAPATVKTEVRIARLQDYVVISFEAQDPEPDRIQAPWRDRDGIDMDDYVTFVLDPAGKNITNYELKVSASGIKGDQIRNRVNDTLIRDWEPKWESAAKIVSEGYIVEIMIPLAEFDFPMHEGVKRLVAFKRHYPREIRRTLGAIAVIEAREETPGLEKNLLIVPTASFEYERERPISGEDRRWEATEDPTVSLDVAYKPTPSLTFLGTVNPNYLQVEADLAKSSINNAFTTFQPEKRLFFTLNQDNFSSLYHLVYTRNIDEPRVGVKLSGSVKDVTLGNFLVYDKNLKLIVPGNLSSETETFDSGDNDNLSGAFRYRYDFKPGLSLGAIVTGRAGADYSEVSDYRSVAAGVDGYVKLGRYDEVRGQWVISNTEYPEAIVDKLCGSEGACDDPEDDPGVPGESSFNEQVLRADPDRTYRDDAWWVSYKHWQREWFLKGRYLDVGEDFRGDLGFIKKVDYRLVSASGGYTWFFYQKDESVRRMRLFANYIRQETQAGELLMDMRDVWLVYWGRYQSSIRIAYRNRDRVAKRFLQNTLEIDDNAPEFNEDQFLFRIETSPFRNIRLFLFGTIGQEIDKDNYRLGDVLLLEPEIRWYVGDKLELTLKSDYKQLDVEGGRLFTENYLTLSLTYQFTKDVFVRLTFIDDYVRRDPDLYLYEEEKAMERETTSELLLSWKRGNKSRFLVGLKGGAQDSSELNEPTFDNWLFYVKLSRAFRL